MALTLLDWRRRISALYAEVRNASDPALAHAAWVAGRNDLLRSHPQSPVPASERAGYRGAPVAAYDPTLRFDVLVDSDVPPLTWEYPTASDGVVAFRRIGVAALPDVGAIDVWWLESYGGGIFLPLKDPSPDTYGGGRYVLDTVKGADLGGNALAGRLTIDLNFAYNPSCAYNPEWTCPLAPAGNTVTVSVGGGERVLA